MNDLANSKGNFNATHDPDGIFRTRKYELNGELITVLRSPFDFTKKTEGAAKGVEYLLDERNVIGAIRETKAKVKEKIIRLGVIPSDDKKDPNINHRPATLSLAQKGSAEIETAIGSNSKVVIFRGAHDAMDIAGALRATDGKLGIVIVDTHTDIHTPKTSTSKNPHGMWVSTLLGEGEGLDPVMEDTPRLKPENIIYIVPSQIEDAEVKRLTDRGIKVFIGQNLSNLEPIYAALDELQERVPLWFEVDEDALVGASATMPGGMVTPEQLKGVANRIGTNQKVQNMHKVLGIGISEFQAPQTEEDEKNAEMQAEVIKSTVHQALGAGFHEESTDTGNGHKKHRARNNKSSTLRNVMYGTTAAAALVAATVGAFVGGKNTDKSTTIKSASSAKLPPKSGLLLAAITTPDNRPSILADEWNAESMKNRGESITDVFIEHIARYGKRFQEICDKTKAGTYSKDEFTYPIFYMPNACLSEMATYLLEAEKRDPSSSESLHAAVLASYEATFERKEGRTLPREGYAMFETLYQDFKTRTAAEKSPQ